MGKITYVLFEAASGYSLFEVDGGDGDAIATMLPQVQESVSDFGKFGSLCQLKAFTPFASAEDALANINDISEGIMNETLHTFLEMNLPKMKEGKKGKFQLGVIEPNVGKAIQDSIGVPCVSNDAILELIRGIRHHFTTYVKQLSGGGFEKAQLGLGHSYSRARVKFNVHRADNMIIQSIALLDQLDKDINTNSMRVREWYSWHFPEMGRIVKDNTLYARVAAFIGARSTLTEEGKLEELTKITMDEEIAKEIMEASTMSMGMDVSEIDLININAFTSRLVSLVEYRANLSDYLSKRMDAVAPNLAALIGDTVAARLISHAGSLTNLSKCPASTVQILGAEKALFRALKTKGNTPKYGLIFHSSFIGRASAKNKGRISRYLANKCSMAARIDCFSDEQTKTYGEAMKEQVEERLAFYDSGVTPKKNIDVMKKVADSLTSKVGGKRKRDDTDEVDDEEAPKKSKKSKKDKKKDDVTEMEVEAPAADSEEKGEKKKKKKKDKKKEMEDDE